MLCHFQEKMSDYINSAKINDSFFAFYVEFKMNKILPGDHKTHTAA